MSKTNETRHIEWHEMSVNLELVFVIIDNVGIKVNADGSAKN